MTYPLSYRRKVLSVRDKEHLTISEVSSRFCVGVATVTRWIKRLEPQTTRYKPATVIDRIALARDVRDYPDAYLSERAERLGCSVRGVCHALKRIGVSYKKNSETPQSQRRRTACLPRKN